MASQTRRASFWLVDDMAASLLLVEAIGYMSRRWKFKSKFCPLIPQKSFMWSAVKDCLWEMWWQLLSSASSAVSRSIFISSLPAELWHRYSVPCPICRAILQESGLSPVLFLAYVNDDSDIQALYYDIKIYCWSQDRAYDFHVFWKNLSEFVSWSKLQQLNISSQDVVRTNFRYECFFLLGMRFYKRCLRCCRPDWPVSSLVLAMFQCYWVIGKCYFLGALQQRCTEYYLKSFITSYQPVLEQCTNGLLIWFLIPHIREVHKFFIRLAFWKAYRCPY